MAAFHPRCGLHPSYQPHFASCHHPHHRPTGPLPQPPRRQVHERYTALARSALNFEKAAFAGWRDGADAAAMAHLKQPILSKDADTGARPPCGAGPCTDPVAFHSPTWLTCMTGHLHAY